jgi:hypothetical protein
MKIAHVLSPKKLDETKTWRVRFEQYLKQNLVLSRAVLIRLAAKSDMGHLVRKPQYRPYGEDAPSCKTQDHLPEGRAMQSK